MGADDADAKDDEKPVHQHAMPKGYWIGRTCVTWSQYLEFCTATHRGRPYVASVRMTDVTPMVEVKWADLHEENGYLAWSGLSLPTEAEWEKASRGARGGKYPWGDLDPSSSLCAWNKHPKYGAGTENPPDVGIFPEGASPFGALDMAGSVSQWCEDWYDAKAYARYATGDLAPPATGTDHVCRGGSWLRSAAQVRSASRDKHRPGFNDSLLGFRVVLRLPAEGR
jgi:formylglycine-generating enzyme required for sulfatase activity